MGKVAFKQREGHAQADLYHIPMLHEQKSEERPRRDRRDYGIPFHSVPASSIYGRMKLPFNYKALLQLETTSPSETK